MGEASEAAGNLTAPLMESVASTVAALLPLVFLLGMLGMALASFTRASGLDVSGGSLLDALVEWAGTLRTPSVGGDEATLEEWRPYIAAGGVILAALACFGLLLLSPAL
jgi:hypothetical protein